MRVFAVVLALGLLLASAPSYAQGAATQKPAPPAPAAPATQKPAAPAPAPPAPAAPRFQDGLKYAYLNIQAIAANSAEGKALSAKVQAMQDQKAKELNDKNKQLQASQDRLDKGGSVMSDQARQSLQLEIEKQQRDIQRFTEDAQQDLQSLQQQLLGEFERKLAPVVQTVATQKGIHFIFGPESGLVWADPTMDLTGDVLQAFDAATKTAK